MSDKKRVLAETHLLLCKFKDCVRVLVHHAQREVVRTHEELCRENGRR